MTLRRWFVLVLLAIVAMYLAACLFVHPIADDFIFASDARAGLWTAWLAEYRGWAGRYASNALVLIAPALAGPGVYRPAAALMIGGLIAASYAFVRAASADRLTRQEAWACSLVFSVLYLSHMPSLGESVYWYTAAVTHYVPLVLLLFHLALVASYLRTDGRGFVSRAGLALAVLLLIAAAGCNEVIMLMLLAFYFVWAVWSLGAPGAISSRLPRVLFVVAALCAVAVLASPGNGIRRALYAAVHHRVGLTIVMTALQTLRFSIDWLSSGALILATLLFSPIAVKWGSGWLRDSRQATQLTWLLAAGLLLAVPAAVLPAYWETGVLGQHRTVNTAYFAFLLLWFAAAAAWLASGGRHAEAAARFSGEFRTPIAVLLLAALAFTHNSYTLGLDFVSGRLSAFDREMSNRDSALGACRDRGARTCDVAAILARPASFFVLDISPDKGDWVNASYARYFGLDEVRLESGR